MSGGFCAQLALVLRKNLIFKKRNRKDVLLEILFPCLFFLLLGVLKSNVGAANQLRAAPSRARRCACFLHSYRCVFPASSDAALSHHSSLSGLV